MRMTQIIGLNQRAIDFLDKNKAIYFDYCDCPHCDHPHIKKDIIEVYDDITGVQAGMFDDGPVLRKWQLKDLSWIYEYVQYVEWSSGPCIFLSLRGAKEGDDGEFEENGIDNCDWTEEEIRENV